MSSLRLGPAGNAAQEDRRLRGMGAVSVLHRCLAAPTPLLTVIAFVYFLLQLNGFNAFTKSNNYLIISDDVADAADRAADPSSNNVQHNNPTVVLDVHKACPLSSVINKVNSNSPPPELMPTGESLSIIKFWHEINCPQKNTCNFFSIGQHLLHIAMKRNQTLLTVQVGGMDGRSNDPLFEMFVQTRGKNFVQARYGEILPGKDSSFPDLKNWLPVVIEPVPKNYEDLVQTYVGIANSSGLGCGVPIHAAVSYDSTKTSCPFCRVNTADDAPDKCKSKCDEKINIFVPACQLRCTFFLIISRCFHRFT